MARIQGALPNALSLSRLPLGVCFLLLYDVTSRERFCGALAIAALALLTDFFDGWLARRLQVASEFGGLVDGLGDKAFYVAVYLSLERQGVLPPFLAWILI